MSFIFTMIYDPFSSVNYSISHNALFSFHRMIQFLHLKYTFGFFQLLLILSAANCFVSFLLASNIRLSVSEQSAREIGRLSSTFFL